MRYVVIDGGSPDLNLWLFHFYDEPDTKATIHANLSEARQFFYEQRITSESINRWRVNIRNYWGINDSEIDAYPQIPPPTEPIPITPMPEPTPISEPINQVETLVFGYKAFGGVLLNIADILAYLNNLLLSKATGWTVLDIRHIPANNQIEVDVQPIGTIGFMTLAGIIAAALSVITVAIVVYLGKRTDVQLKQIDNEILNQQLELISKTQQLEANGEVPAGSTEQLLQFFNEYQTSKQESGFGIKETIREIIPAIMPLAVIGLAFSMLKER